jgi:hypothetical protein
MRSMPFCAVSRDTMATIGLSPHDVNPVRSRSAARFAALPSCAVSQ